MKSKKKQNSTSNNNNNNTKTVARSNGNEHGESCGVASSSTSVVSVAHEEEKKGRENGVETIQDQDHEGQKCAASHDHDHQDSSMRIKDEPGAGSFPGRSVEQEKQEAEHFAIIVKVFRYYVRRSMEKLQADYLSYSRMSERHRKLLYPSFPKHLTEVKKCIKTNGSVIDLVLEDVTMMFENVDYAIQGHKKEVSEFNLEKLRSVMRTLVRDWSSEGAKEREASYGPVIAALQKEFPNPEGVTVCVPGAGLGRLAWDVSNAGFRSQGNEFSLFMLFWSNFILNRCNEIDMHTIYPYIHQGSNNMKYSDRLRPAHFPDVSPSDLPPNAQFSMCAGDFLDVYACQSDEWDSVATVFFLDTAKNALAFIDQIHDMLKPGGIWINMGPLLYHFEDTPGEDSIELPYAEIRRIIETVGFTFEVEQTNVSCTYTQNRASMLQYNYRCVFFVARKLAVTAPAAAADNSPSTSSTDKNQNDSALDEPMGHQNSSNTIAGGENNDSEKESSTGKDSSTSNDDKSTASHVQRISTDDSTTANASPKSS